MAPSAAFEAIVPSVQCTLITNPIDFSQEEYSTEFDVGVHLDTGRVSILKRLPHEIQTTCSSFSTYYKKKAQNAASGDHLKTLKDVRRTMFDKAILVTACTSLFFVLLSCYLSSFKIFMSLFIIGCSVLFYWVVNNMLKLMAYNKEIKERVEAMKSYSFDPKIRQYDNNSDSEVQYVDYTKVYTTMPLSTFMLPDGLSSQGGNEDILYMIITYLQSQENLKGLYEKFCNPYRSLQKLDRWLRLSVFQSKLKAVLAVIRSIQAESESIVIDENTYDDEIDACIEQSKTRRVDELITCFITLHSLQSEWTHLLGKEPSSLYMNDSVKSVADLNNEINTSIQEGIAAIQTIEKNAVERVESVLAFAKHLTGKTIDGESESESGADTSSTSNKNDSSAALTRSAKVYTKYYAKAMNLLCANSRVVYDDHAHILLDLALIVREIKTLHFVLKHKQSLLTYLQVSVSITNLKEYHKEKKQIESEDAKMESYYGGHPNDMRTSDNVWAQADFGKFRERHPELASEIEDYGIENSEIEISGLKTRESGVRAITNNVRIFRFVQQCHLIVRRLKYRCNTKKHVICLTQSKALEEEKFNCSNASDYLLIKDKMNNAQKMVQDWDEEVDEYLFSTYKSDWGIRLINGQIVSGPGGDEYWEYRLLDYTEKASDLDIKYFKAGKIITEAFKKLIPLLKEKSKKAYTDSLPEREEVTMEDIFVGNTVSWCWSVPDAEIEWTWPVKISKETKDLIVTNVLGSPTCADDFRSIIEAFVGEFTSTGGIKYYINYAQFKDCWDYPAQVSSHSLYQDKVVFHFANFDTCIKFYRRFFGTIKRAGYLALHKDGKVQIFDDPAYLPLDDPELKEYQYLYKIELDLKVEDVKGDTGNVRSMKFENLVSYNPEFDHAPTIVAFPSTTNLGGNYRLQNLDTMGRYQIWKFIDLARIQGIRRYFMMLNEEIPEDVALSIKQPPPAIVHGKPALFYVNNKEQALVDLPEDLEPRIASGWNFYGPFFIFGPFGEYTKVRGERTAREVGLTSTLKFPVMNGGVGVQNVDYSNF